MTLITHVFYSTRTISAWLLEKWRRVHTSSQGAELVAGVHALLVKVIINGTKAANSAPVSAIFFTTTMTSELFP